nr:MAG TPA: hypothetical protein [Caudoviricetes sp.]
MASSLSIVDEIRKAINYGSQAVAGASKEASKYARKSIARGANDATIQFPCLVSRSCPIDMANSCMRLLDRTYAEFVKIYFSMNSTIDISVDPTPAHYLRKYHQNLSLESKDSPVKDDTEVYVSEDKKVCVSYEPANGKGHFSIKEENARQLKPVLSQYDLRPFPGMMLEFGRDEDDTVRLPKSTQETLLANALANSQKEDDKSKREWLNTKASIAKNINAPKLTDSDAQKANDMMPYGVEVKLMAINGDQEFVNYMTFIVGVKAVLHPIDSDDMTTNIIRTLTNSSNVFNFIRWTTGEISFFKDFLFNVKNIRDDVRGKSTTGNPYFAALRRAKNAGVSVSKLGVNKMIPNATVIITDSECEFLKSKGFDLTNPRIAKILISKLFLMTFVILDEASRVISILYDGSDDFQVFSIESLEKDVAMSSSKLSKEIGRMISY